MECKNAPLQNPHLCNDDIIDVYHLIKLKERWQYLIVDMPDNHHQKITVEKCIADLNSVLQLYSDNSK